MERVTGWRLDGSTLPSRLIAAQLSIAVACGTLTMPAATP
jgi:hypothetical protein